MHRDTTQPDIDLNPGFQYQGGMQLTTPRPNSDKPQSVFSMNRREWMRRSGLITGAVAATSLFNQEAAAAAASDAFTLDLTVWKLGIQGNQNEAISWARQFGFQSVGAHTEEIKKWNDADHESYAQQLMEADLKWGTASMPVEFRKDESRFQNDIRSLPSVAKSLKKAGVTSAITHIMPNHSTLTYKENFKQHSMRLKQISKILADNGLRFGMEYVGTESLRNRRKFPFIHTLREGLELIESIGLDTVGLVMDCWHWHNAQDNLEDLKLLKPRHVVSIELNDAQPGIKRPFLQDNRRELPCSTGVIDTAGFLNGLAQQGIRGPVMAEPFNQQFRDMPRSRGIGFIAQSLRKALSMVQ